MNSLPCSGRIVDIQTKIRLVNNRIRICSPHHQILLGELITSEYPARFSHTQCRRAPLNTDIGKSGNVIFEKIDDLANLPTQRSLGLKNIRGVERVNTVFLRGIDHTFRIDTGRIKANNIHVFGKLSCRPLGAALCFSTVIVSHRAASVKTSGKVFPRSVRFLLELCMLVCYHEPTSPPLEYTFFEEKTMNDLIFRIE